MSYILRRQRVAYDNLAIASAATQENMLVATDVPGYRLKANNIKLTEGTVAAMASSTEPTSVTMNSIITQAGGRTTLDPQERMAVASS
jgi:hypothetical protein